MLFANVCAGFISSCYGECFLWRVLDVLVSPWCFVHMGSSGLSGLPVVYKTLGSSGVPPAGHALWSEVGGGITFVTSGKNT